MARKSTRSLTSRLLAYPAQPLPEGTSVAVIGGGLAGCSAANALATRGMRVLLYEREPAVATQTSNHPAAVVFPMAAKQATTLRAFYEAAYHAILAKIAVMQRHTPFCEWQQTGAIHLLVNDRLAHLWENLAGTGMPSADFQRWTGAQTAAATGGLIEAPALAYPTAGYIQPPAWCEALCQHPNIQVKLHQSALQLEADREGWQVTTSQNTSKAAAVVIANGLEALRFEQTSWLPLNCFRGQLAYIDLNHAPQWAPQVICHEGYLIPDCGTGHLAGATFHPADRDPNLKPESQDHLITQIRRWLPWFLKGEPELKGRVAFRAQSPDHLPMAGPVANYQEWVKDFAGFHHGKAGQKYPAPTYHQNLYVSTGHASRGTVSCWLAGEILASKIAGAGPVLDPHQCAQLNPARFILRALKRDQSLTIPPIPPDELPQRLPY